MLLSRWPNKIRSLQNMASQGRTLIRLLWLEGRGVRVVHMARDKFVVCKTHTREMGTAHVAT